jgi:hypothetical protein
MTTMTVSNDGEDADNLVHEPNAAAAVKFSPWNFVIKFDKYVLLKIEHEVILVSNKLCFGFWTLMFSYRVFLKLGGM